MDTRPRFTRAAWHVARDGCRYVYRKGDRPDEKLSTNAF